MDPSANLEEQLEIVEKVRRGQASFEDLDRLADLVEALDCWLKDGGFLPARWRQ